jgi:signal transduction histidine kinase
MIREDVATRVTSSAAFLDWLPVAVVPPILIADAAASSGGKPITVVAVLAAFVGCLPLAVWRRVPFPVMFPLVTAGIILILWQLHPPNTVVIMPMIVLFELALSGDRRRSLWMGVATVPCVFISCLPFQGSENLASLVIRNLALCVLAIAAGDVVRARKFSAQQALDAVEQRTLRRVGEERLRIAREIHDVVAHAMTAINVQAGVAAHLLERDPGQAYDALRNIKQTSGAALSDLRSTLEVLRDPSQAAPLGPPAGLDDIGELTGGLRAAGVDVEVDVEAADGLPAAVQSAGYRIVQEALTNVARHADGASRARVNVRRVPGAVTIEVIDDGGAASGNGAAGNGVRGMRERAAALGGTLEAAPVDSGGWRVLARLPLGAGARNVGAPAVAGGGEPSVAGEGDLGGQPTVAGGRM